MHSRISDYAWCGAIALAYVVAAEIGFSLTFATKQVTAVWPPTGIALAALLLLGIRVWPGVFVGAFVSNALSDEPTVTAALISVGNTLAPLLGVWLLRRSPKFDHRLRKLPDVLRFVFFGAAVAMTVSATNGVVNLAMAGIIEWHAIFSVWWVWWIGDSMGVLLVAPAILTWAANSGPLHKSERTAELVIVTIVLVGATGIFFSSTLPLAYPIFPILIWIALRFESRVTMAAVLLVSAVAVWQTINDRGPFGVGVLDQRMMLLVTFMAILAVTALVIGAVSAEMKAAQGALRGANEELEARVGARTSDLKASEEKFRNAFDTAPHGMALVSPEGRWLRVNKAFREFLGYTEEEFFATTFAAITHPEDIAADLAQAEQLLAGTINSYQMEKRYRHKRGDFIWGLLSVSLVRDAHGVPINFVSQVIDIDRRKRVEEALIDARAAAEAANQAKGRFLAVMSHELRTPMTGVLGMADLLFTTELTPEQEKYTKTLAQSARGLLNLLNDILDFSKIEAGQLRVERAPLLLPETLASVRDLFAGPASEKSLVTLLKISPALQVPILGDAARIRQVVSNFVSNAIKFTNEGSVTVTAEERAGPALGTRLAISVTDTGIGIPSETINRLFQPFAQADVSITRKFGGTGLGLAISQSLARAMGGKIEVVSEVGKGSTFTLDIPLEYEVGGVATSRTEDTVQSSREIVLGSDENKRRPLNILLAEDNTTTCMLVTAVLNKMGDVVTAVADGAEAVAAFRSNTYDVILMDMQMPVMDGPDAIRAIRGMEREQGRGAHIPIIALTADLSQEGQKNYLHSGADAVMGKPVNWKGLTAEMNRLVALSGRPR